MIHPFNVLLVEDNPGDADLARESLEFGNVPVEITGVVDGEQAVNDLLRNSPYETSELPDLLMLDINLPKLDGLPALKEIRSHPALRLLPHHFYDL